VTSPPRLRQGVRAVLIDHDWNILLVHFDFVDERQPNGLWACPGGGLDPGESLVNGLTRELAEETGLRLDAVAGDPVWWKEHTFPMTHWDGQRDTYFFIEVDPFEPAPTLGFERLLAEHVDAVRWWSYDEVQRTQAVFDRGDRADPEFATFSPRALGHHLSALREHGPQRTPVDVSGGER